MPGHVVRKQRQVLDVGVQRLDLIPLRGALACVHARLSMAEIVQLLCVQPERCRLVAVVYRTNLRGGGDSEEGRAQTATAQDHKITATAQDYKIAATAQDHKITATTQDDKMTG